ncbi:iron ABC transporter permease [Paenibacillus oryzisoli]|uniref:FecCD family ABC transporter permease n=1 Tax=Paenibacillus oryzisoli TaxID=1850517 RepID=UPI003D28178F
MNATRSNLWRTGWLLTFVLVLLGCFVSSILFGATQQYHWSTAWASMFHYDESINDQIIVRTTRVPRACIAAAVGASLAIAGALMQTLTRNPLASPSVLGVNAGATFFVVLAAVMLSVSSMQALTWIAFLGAAVGAVTVYALGSLGRDGLTPLKIVLAGSAMSALFASFTQAVLVLRQQGIGTVLFWLTGTVAGRSPSFLITVIPYLIVVWIGSWLLSKEMNLLQMGEETAKGLGQKTILIKATAGIFIVVLAGCSVSVAGPIGFIGIVIPHISRFFGGMDHRWVIPYCGVLGAILLILADIGARFIAMPEEMPVGVMTAVIGVPFFIYIARKGLAKS